MVTVGSLTTLASFESAAQGASIVLGQPDEWTMRQRWKVVLKQSRQLIPADAGA